MLRALRPDERAETVLDVDYDRLWRSGKRAILFDMDNTLGRRNASRPADRVLELLDELSDRGFRIGILSNRRFGLDGEMVRTVSERYPMISAAGKPRTGHLRRMLEQLGVSQDEAIMIGDRILTDVLAGNRAGLHTIRVTRAL